MCGWAHAFVVSSDNCFSFAGVGKRGWGEVLVETSPLGGFVLVMNNHSSQSTPHAHLSSSSPTVTAGAAPALFFTRTRVPAPIERQSIFRDWGSGGGLVVQGVDGQWSKNIILEKGTSIPV